jgi:hypothetical protein
MPHIFGATDLFSALGITDTNKQYFEIQESSLGAESDEAVVRTREGIYVPASHVQHNKRSVRTFVITANDPDGQTLTIPMGGAGTTGVVVTTAAIRTTGTSHAQITVTAHVHDGSTNHLADTPTSFITPALGFGVLEALLGGTLADCQSSDITASIQHVDRTNNVGNHLVGASRGFMVEVSETYLSQGTPPAPDANDWLSPLVSQRQVNVDFQEYIVTAKRYAVLPTE